MCSQERLWTQPVRGEQQQTDAVILAEKIKKKKRDFTENLRSCESSGGEGALLYHLLEDGYAHTWRWSCTALLGQCHAGVFGVSLTHRSGQHWSWGSGGELPSQSAGFLGLS